jgi:hypothetical protein
MVGADDRVADSIKWKTPTFAFAPSGDGTGAAAQRWGM